MMNPFDEARIRRALHVSLSGLEDDPNLTRKVLRKAHADRSKARRKKPVAALALALVLVLASALGLAIVIALHTLTSHVAQMDAGGQMLAWGLEEKLTFIQAMRESGFDMNEADWLTLTDSSLDDAVREEAADRIVYARYGVVQEEENALRPVPSDSVMGEAPDAVLIFRERYLAEHPNASHYDYLDALGYWLRDEYWPQFRASLEANASHAPEIKDNTLTQEMAEADVQSYLTEILNLPASSVQSARITSTQDADSGAWHVQSAFSLPQAGTLEEHPWVTKAGSEYRLSFWILRAENGDWCRAQTLDELLSLVRETNRRIALHTIYPDEAAVIALRAVQDTYGLSEAEIKRYFVYDADTYWNDPDCIRLGIMLRTRNNSGAP